MKMPPPKFTVDEAREHVTYDPETGLFTRISTGMGTGSPHTEGYVVILMKGRRALAHRLAWAMMHGAWPTLEIDHINGDRSDNRIVNLREVTRFENKRNCKLYKNNKSGVVGVRFNASRGKYDAWIREGGKSVRLGEFDTLEQAAEARRQASVRAGYHENHGQR